MATLRSRVENLEACASVNSQANHCLVVHSADCENDRKKAVAAYVEKHGRAPTDVFNVYIVSSTTKQRVCSCTAALRAERMRNLDDRVIIPVTVVDLAL